MTDLKNIKTSDITGYIGSKCKYDEHIIRHCKICNLDFYTKEGMKAHLTSKHKIYKSLKKHYKRTKVGL